MLTPFSRATVRLVAGALLGALTFASPASLRAQDADFIAVVKIQSFNQVGPLLVTLRDEDFDDPDAAPFRFAAIAEASAPNALTSGTVLPPGGSSIALGLVGGGEELIFTEGFELFTDLNAAFEAGTYQLDLVGPTTGRKRSVWTSRGTLTRGCHASPTSWPRRVSTLPATSLFSGRRFRVVRLGTS